MARTMWSTNPRLEGIPGSQKEAPDELPGSWGEGRLKKIPLIEKCEGIAANNGSDPNCG